MDKPQQKILHITPHFAPEKCGISDYVVCWKNWLGQQDDIFIAALSDRFHPGVFRGARLLRVGAEQQVSLALKMLVTLVQENAFDAVVIHYVPQGYSRHGLPLWLVRLAKLLRKTNLPVTLLAHEIWAGGPGKTFRVRVKGTLQKQFLLSWIRMLGKPQIITTSAFTAAALGRNGLPVSFCPVFSNVGETAEPTGLSAELLQSIADPSFTHLLMFGSIPPDAPPRETAGFLSVLVEVKGKPLKIWHAGYASADAFSTVGSYLQKGQMMFEHLGPLPPPAINWLMRHCDWGLSTYPIELWSKSGSIAAMLANGLPVAVTGRLPGPLLPITGTFPEKLLPWLLLPAVEQAARVKAMGALPSVPRESYNSHIAKRLHALTGLGKIAFLSDEEPGISVIITAYRCWPKALQCLEHLFAADDSGLIAEVLLINDDPADPVPEAIAANNRVKLVQNETNLGYVASVNRGMALAAHNLVLLLDADAYLLDGLLPAVDLLSSAPELKLVLPAARMENGMPVRRLYPAPRLFSLLMGQGFEAFWEKFKPGPQTIAHSYAWLVARNDFLELGGLDTKLHFLEADVDFCMRLHQKYPGSVAVCEAVRVVHEGGANPIRRNQRVVEWYRSRWYLLNKHGFIHFKTFSKGLIGLRLYIETGFSALLSHLQPGRHAFWQQKSEGRKMLLKDLNNW